MLYVPLLGMFAGTSQVYLPLLGAPVTTVRTCLRSLAAPSMTAMVTWSPRRFCHSISIVSPALNTAPTAGLVIKFGLFVFVVWAVATAANTARVRETAVLRKCILRFDGI